MNGTEQRQRHTVVKALEGQVEDVRTLLLEMAAENVAAKKATDKSLQELRQAAWDFANDRPVSLTISARIDGLKADHEKVNSAICTGMIEMRTWIEAWEERTFWQRLRWLVTGR